MYCLSGCCFVVICCFTGDVLSVRIVLCCICCLVDVLYFIGVVLSFQIVIVVFPFSLLLSLRIVVRSTVRSNWYFIFHLRCFFYSDCGLWYCFVYLALYVPLWLCLSARIVFCCTLSSYWNFIFRLRCFFFYSDCGLLYCYVLLAVYVSLWLCFVYPFFAAMYCKVVLVFCASLVMYRTYIRIVFYFRYSVTLVFYLSLVLFCLSRL
jgi:hypothetical protein